SIDWRQTSAWASNRSARKVTDKPSERSRAPRGFKRARHQLLAGHDDPFLNTIPVAISVSRRAWLPEHTTLSLLSTAGSPHRSTRCGGFRSRRTRWRGSAGKTEKRAWLYTQRVIESSM